ncbi:MAG: DUF4136 domain-containing protein [Elusimicrobiota bacterium]
MKKLICLILSASVFLGGVPAYPAQSTEEIRKANVGKCVEQFVASAPDDFKAKNISLVSNADPKNAGWMEEGIVSAFMSMGISIIEQTGSLQGTVQPDYIVNYNLIEQKKESVKIGFKLVDGKTGKLIKYSTMKGTQVPENFDYERRVPKPAYQRVEGTPWGLFVVIGLVLFGYALQPKI